MAKGNRNQGASPPREEFGRTGKTTAEGTNQTVADRMRLYSPGLKDDRPRMWINEAVTDVSGVATFYVTFDGTNTGGDVMVSYESVKAWINSASALYVIGWALVGHTVTVTVKQVTIVAGVLDFTAPAVGVTVSVEVLGEAG